MYFLRRYIRFDELLLLLLVLVFYAVGYVQLT